MAVYETRVQQGEEAAEKLQEYSDFLKKLEDQLEEWYDKLAPAKQDYEEKANKYVEIFN